MAWASSAPFPGLAYVVMTRRTGMVHSFCDCVGRGRFSALPFVLLMTARWLHMALALSYRTGTRYCATVGLQMSAGYWEQARHGHTPRFLKTELPTNPLGTPVVFYPILL